MHEGESKTKGASKHATLASFGTTCNFSIIRVPIDGPVLPHCGTSFTHLFTLDLIWDQKQLSHGPSGNCTRSYQSFLWSLNFLLHKFAIWLVTFEHIFIVRSLQVMCHFTGVILLWAVAHLMNEGVVAWRTRCLLVRCLWLFLWPCKCCIDFYDDIYKV